jgi:hypothetical protein
MEFDRFHQFGSLLLHDDFVFSYSGYVTEDILEAVGATLRQRLADHIDKPKQIRNVFSIFVELIQNVIRYGTDGPQPVGKCGDRGDIWVGHGCLQCCLQWCIKPVRGRHSGHTATGKPTTRHADKNA